jgi:hypothetical protein
MKPSSGALPIVTERIGRPYRGRDEVDTLKLDQIEVKSYVGELVKSFERKVA